MSEGAKDVGVGHKGLRKVVRFVGVERGRNPLPPRTEGPLFATLRDSLEVPDERWVSGKAYVDLNGVGKMLLGHMMDGGFFRRHNPIVRHTVLRKRRRLEESGLITPVGVDVHPDPDRPASAYPGLVLEGKGLVTNLPFKLAYEAAERFSELLRQRTPSAGFLKSMMLQRLCSSFASGLGPRDRAQAARPRGVGRQGTDVVRRGRAGGPDGGRTGRTRGDCRGAVTGGGA